MTVQTELKKIAEGLYDDLETTLRLVRNSPVKMLV